MRARQLLEAILISVVASTSLGFFYYFATVVRPANTKEYDKCKAAGGEFMRPAVGNAGPVCAKRIPLNL